uniref:Uncharacterized protein n=1 Tax=Flabellia petiolata TaxID=189428 RepID=A0A386AX21_9CHLO|nr:hypothetical protein [Flabellia petiolata]
MEVTQKKSNQIIFKDIQSLNLLDINFRTLAIGLQLKLKYINNYSVFKNKFIKIYFKDLKKKNFEFQRKYFFYHPISEQRFFCEFKINKKDLLFEKNTCILSVNRQGISVKNFLSKIYRIEKYRGAFINLSYFNKSKNFISGQRPKSKNPAAAFGGPKTAEKPPLNFFYQRVSKKIKLNTHALFYLFLKKSASLKNFTKKWIRQNKKFKLKIINWKNTPTHKYIFLIHLLDFLNTQQILKGFTKKKKVKIGQNAYIRIFICINKKSEYKKYEKTNNQNKLNEPTPRCAKAALKRLPSGPKGASVDTRQAGAPQVSKRGIKRLPECASRPPRANSKGANVGQSDKIFYSYFKNGKYRLNNFGILICSVKKNKFPQTSSNSFSDFFVEGFTLFFFKFKSTVFLKSLWSILYKKNFKNIYIPRLGFSTFTTKNRIKYESQSTWYFFGDYKTGRFSARYSTYLKNKKLSQLNPGKKIFLIGEVLPQSLTSVSIGIFKYKAVSFINRVYSNKLQKKVLDFYLNSYYILLKNFYLLKNFKIRFSKQKPKKPIFNNFYPIFNYKDFSFFTNSTTTNMNNCKVESISKKSLKYFLFYNKNNFHNYSIRYFKSKIMPSVVKEKKFRIYKKNLNRSFFLLIRTLSLYKCFKFTNKNINNFFSLNFIYYKKIKFFRIKKVNFTILNALKRPELNLIYKKCLTSTSRQNGLCYQSNFLLIPLFDKKFKLFLISILPIFLRRLTKLSYKYKTIHENTNILKINLVKTNRLKISKNFCNLKIIQKNFFQSFENQIFIRFFLSVDCGEIIAQKTAEKRPPRKCFFYQKFRFFFMENKSNK